MRHALARPEQSQCPARRFPLFAAAGCYAADLWLRYTPLSAGEWRDLRFRNLVAGLGWLDQPDARRTAFDDAFGRRIAQAIAPPNCARVDHA